MIRRLARPLASLVVLCVVVATVDGAPKPRLKEGDAVEYNFGGIKQGTFVRVEANGWIRIKRDNGREITLPPENVKEASRAPAADVAEPKVDKKMPVKTPPAEATTENPFETEEERNAKSEPREWVDQSGKHKVLATFVRIENRLVVLRRADGKEVKLQLDKLSGNDQRYVLKRIADSRMDFNAPAGPEIELTSVDLSSAPLVDLSASDDWSYRPDPALPEEVAIGARRVSLGKKPDFFDKATGLFILPEQKKALVIISSEHPGQERSSTVVSCDLGTQRVDGRGVFGVGISPIDVSRDGTLVLAKSSGFGFGKERRLSLHAVEGRDAKAKTAWQPYSGRDENDHDTDVAFARFLGSDHVLTVNHKGIVGVWNVSDGVQPVYAGQASHGAKPAVSGNEKYLAIPAGEGVAIVEALSGEKAGFLKTDEKLWGWSAVAFNRPGTRLALYRPGRMRVWNLDNQELYRDFPVSVGPGDGLEWTDDERLLVNDRHLIDIERRLYVWQYTQLGASTMRDSRLYFVGAGLQPDEWVLGGAKLPDGPASEALSRISPEDALTVKPGMSAKLESQLTMADATQRQAAETALRDKLTANGMQLADDAPLKLVAKLQNGESTTIEYRSFGAFQGQTSKHTFTPQILELTYEFNGLKLWHWRSENAAPHFLDLKKDETIDQALRKHMIQDVSQLSQVWLPKYVAGPPDGKPMGMSPTPVGGAK